MYFQSVFRVCVLVWLSISFGYSQNLVENGNFEDIRVKISEPSSHLNFAYSKYKGNYLANVIPPWKNVRARAPYVIEGKANKAPHKKGYKLDVVPKSGNVMLGLKTHPVNRGGVLFFIKLSQKTEKDKRYKVSCWKANSIYSKYINDDVYFLFTNDPVNVIDNETKHLFQVLKSSKKTLKDWEYLETSVVAEDSYEYLVAGSRYNASDYQQSMTPVPSTHTIDAALFYIDDMMVVLDNTPKPIVVKEEKKPKVKTEVVMLKNIAFQHDSYDLVEDSRLNLRGLYQKLSTLEIINISIAGYTNALGEESYNKLLSSKRAESVYNYLAQLGIVKHKMTYSGYGEQNLLDLANPNSDENRRVEITINYQ